MYDVIVVGGGVAGAYLSSRLNGLNVLLIEKNKRVTLKDSGIVSSDFLEFFDERLIKCGIDRINAFSPSGHSFALHDRKPFAYILKREVFSKYLRAQARKKAKIVYETVTEIHYFEDRVSVNTTGGTYDAKIVVGADGANSMVRKAAGIESPVLSLGILIKTRTKMDGAIDVFFNKHFSPDFFAWIIPQNDEYGTISSVRPREYLKNFEKKFYLPGGQTIAYMIPTGYVRSYANRTLLVGDAAGQNKPLTGGGIMFGLKAACYASFAINGALENRRFDYKHLSNYEKSWKKDFAWEIDKQFLARMLYRRLTNKQLDKIVLQLGPHIEKLSGFDYDKFSHQWMRMPKTKLLAAAISAFT